MHTEKKPFILISNDDGITSKGIRTLVECALPFGDVAVVAPDSPQSGMGHAITIHDPLKVRKSTIFESIGVLAFECSGTPADCIKLAKNYLFKDKTPSIVLSGINHGSNLSISILYSGTMSAAMEAAIEDLPAVGFSVCDYDDDADFTHTLPYIKQVISEVLTKGLPRGTTLNVNFPKAGIPLKGIKVCRQAKAKWEEDFDERVDPAGRKYLWLAGQFVNYDKGEDTDVWAVEHGYASIVPSVYDLTAHHAIALLNDSWDFEKKSTE